MTPQELRTALEAAEQKLAHAEQAERAAWETYRATRLYWRRCERDAEKLLRIAHDLGGFDFHEQQDDA